MLVTGAGQAAHDPVVPVICAGPKTGVAVALAQVEYCVVVSMIRPNWPALHGTFCCGPAWLLTVQHVPVATHDVWQVLDTGVTGPNPIAPLGLQVMFCWVVI